MLNRFRDFVKRLELPQEEEVVYRIIDNDLNTIEVTAAQYAIWRTQNDVTRRAVVGQDIVEEAMVRTTFSIMPENRAYKPYGTSVYALPLYDPQLEYFQRYDTWAEAENGHRHTLELIRQKADEARADEEISRAFAGTAADVRETLSSQLPDLFSVRRTDDLAVIHTPLTRPDGSEIEVAVATIENGFELSEYGLAQSRLETLQDGALLEALGGTSGDGQLTCRVDDVSQLSLGLLRLLQAISIVTYTTSGNDSD